MNKACPVILRELNGEQQILAFQHPLAGCQIVKGTLEPKETLAQACRRELLEESGISADVQRYLGRWEANFEHQVWGFYLMKAKQPLADQWEHFANDDGGLLFKFFWQPLDEPLDDQWHPLFVNAIAQIRSFVK